jgi:hypothetical protein
MAGIRERDKQRKSDSATGNTVLYLFRVRNMFFFVLSVLSVFERRCPSLRLAVS